MPIADELLNEFETLGRVLSATPFRLHRTIPASAVVVDHLMKARETMVHALRCEVALKPVVSSQRELLDYLGADMANLLTERVRILHLNTQNRLIRDEILSDGTIDQTSFHIREIVRRAIELGSASIIVAHNHPSGSSAPSRSDIEMTRRLSNACGTLGIDLIDHIVIASDGSRSFRALGLF